MQQSLPILNLFAYFCLVIINLLAIQLPFFGKTPGDVSDLFPNLLTPADFAFKIWSVIYVLLGLFVVHQVRAHFQAKQQPVEVSAIGNFFLLSCLLNVAWLVTWQSMHIAWAFLMIFILWWFLIYIYYRLAQLPKARLAYTFPFSIYLAWVCIATLASLNVLLIDLDFGFFGLSEEHWTALLIGIGIGGTLLMLYLNQDIWFTLVLIWAFYGIYVKNQQLAPEGNWVVTMALLAMVSLAVVGLGVGIRKWKPHQG